MSRTPLPKVAGPIVLGGKWHLTLPSPFNQKLADGGLILWDDKLTLWTKGHENSQDRSIEARLDEITAKASTGARQRRSSIIAGIGRCSYLLDEANPATGAARTAFYAFLEAPTARLSLAFYAGEEADLTRAQAIYRSVEFRPASAS